MAFHVLIGSTAEGFTPRLATINKEFEKDITADGYSSIKKWWPTGTPNPQLGMGFDPKNRPKVRVPGKFNMFSFEEYVTIMYYGVIQELELVGDSKKPVSVRGIYRADSWSSPSAP
jgi:hypothetical protein